MNAIPPLVTASRNTIYWVLLTSISLLLCACATSMPSQKSAGFSFIETTIDEILTKDDMQIGLDFLSGKLKLEDL